MLMTAGVRAEFPDADDEEVTRIIRKRLAIVRRVEALPHWDAVK